jgi:hypothetical protein
MASNYNSTKPSFVYFAFSRGSVPGKRNAWFIFYQNGTQGAKPNVRDPISTASRIDQKVGKPDEITESQLLFHHVAD